MSCFVLQAQCSNEAAMGELVRRLAPGLISAHAGTADGQTPTSVRGAACREAGWPSVRSDLRKSAATGSVPESGHTESSGAMCRFNTA